MTPVRVLASAAAGLAAVVLAAGPAFANTVTIHDASHVLDATRVQNEGATLPDPVDVYTTTKDAGDNAAFDRETQTHVTSPTVVVIAMNTQSHHLAIRSGTKSRVSQTAAQSAVQSFGGAFGSGDYTGATVAALSSLRSSIAQAPAGGGGGVTTRRRSSGSGFSLGGLFCIGLIVVVVVIAIVAALARRRRGYERRGQRRGQFGRRLLGRRRPPARRGWHEAGINRPRRNHTMASWVSPDAHWPPSPPSVGWPSSPAAVPPRPPPGGRPAPGSTAA